MDSETRTRLLAAHGCLVAAMELLALAAQATEDAQVGALLIHVAAAHNASADLVAGEWQERADEIAMR